jgi:hypothetical protein
MMLTIEHIDKLRSLLIAAIDKHIAGGGTIISGKFFLIPKSTTDNITACCPIYCLTDSMYDNFERKVAQMLGIDIKTDNDVYTLLDELWAFIHGFDGKPHGKANDRYPDMVALGQELRAKYIKE